MRHADPLAAPLPHAHNPTCWLISVLQQQDIETGLTPEPRSAARAPSAASSFAARLPRLRPTNANAGEASPGGSEMRGGQIQISAAVTVSNTVEGGWGGVEDLLQPDESCLQSKLFMADREVRFMPLVGALPG